MTETRFSLVLTAILAIAFALRVYAGVGDLWLDEIWSLTLLKSVAGPDQIFWKINHDNNHMLNSLWLYWLGPYRSSLLYRMPAIALGTASVAAAGLWARRKSDFAAITAMILFAGSYAMVDLESEARGYAGFILFAILSLIAAEAALEGKRTGLWLGLWMLLGVLSHLLMFVTAAVLGLWFVREAYRRTRSLKKTLRLTARGFGPAIVMVLPVFAEIVWAVKTHRFVIGAPVPFSAGKLAHGFGRMVESCVAVPLLDNPYVYLAGGIALLLVGARLPRAKSPRLSFYLFAFLGVPGLLLLGQMPNSAQPRYFLLSGVAFMLFLADMAGDLWRGGDPRLRACVLAVLGIFVAGDAILLARFLAGGRGEYAAAMRLMAADGPARYATDEARRNPILEEYYIARARLPLSFVGKPKWCETPPRWYLVYEPDHAPAPAEIAAGPDACAQRFDLAATFPQWGFAGVPWAVYRAR